MTDVDRDQLLAAIRSGITAAPNPTSAMQQTVRLLKDGMPDYAWVGIYILDGNELVLGPYVLEKSKQPEWQEQHDWRAEFQLD